MDSNKMLKLFFSYSHKDDEYRKELEEHLAILKRRHLIESWHFQQITPGADWEKETWDSFYSADIIVLLISSSFFKSDFCYNLEMKNAIKLHKEKKCTIIPVKIRPCNISREDPFDFIQALPIGRKAISLWENKDEAWVNVSQGIEKVCMEIIGKPSQFQEKNTQALNNENIDQITILVLAANPIDTSKLRLEEEVRIIQGCFEDRKDVFKVIYSPQTNTKALRETILVHKPTIVHFCGHGFENLGIVVQDDEGLSRTLDFDSLGSLFELFSDNIKCVFLNACFTESQAQAIACHIPIVIAMNGIIEDKIAIRFAGDFYKSFAAGKEYHFSFKYACNGLTLDNQLIRNNPIIIEHGKRAIISIAQKESITKSYKSQESTFINRDNEIKYLTARLNDTLPGSGVMVLHGTSGIGKSELAIELSKKNYRWPFIKVKIPQRGASFREETYYIRKICDSILASNHRIFVDTLEKFIQSLGKEESELLQGQLKNIGARLGQEVNIESHKLSTLDIGVFKVFFNQSYPENVLIIRGYLDAVLSQTGIILNIENVQNIDDSSLQFLIDVVNKYDNLRLLLELTDEDEEGWNTVEFCDMLSLKTIEVEKFELEPLPEKEAIKMLNFGEDDSYVPRSALFAIKNSYAISNGNLRVMVDLNQSRRNDPKSLLEPFTDLEYFTRRNIDGLSSNESFLLAIIIAHGGEASKESLNKLYAYRNLSFPIIDIEHTLSVLLDRELLELNAYSNVINVFQDRIARIFEHEKYSRYHIAAFGFWCFYYESMLEEGFFMDINPADAYVMLIKCYMKLEQVEKVLPIIDVFAHATHRFRSSTRACLYLEKIALSFRSLSDTNKLRRFLLKKVSMLFFLFGMMKRALRLVESLPEDRDVIIFKSALYCWSIHPRTIVYCEEMLNRIDPNKDMSLYLALQLSILSYYRLINKHEACKSLFLRLLKMPNISECLEYGLLLRNAQIALFKEHEVLDYMEESISFFDRKNIPIEEARSRISIVLELSYQGRVDEGIEHIEVAEKLLEKSYSERHSLLNNKAALYIYKGNWDIETLRMLLDARSTATEDFAVFIITMNLMIILVLLSRYPEANDQVRFLLERIEQERPVEKEIKRIAYYNIALYYQVIGYLDKAQLCLTKAKGIFPGFNETEWQEKLNSEKFMDIAYVRKPKFSFQPTFLCFWSPSQSYWFS